MLTCAFPFFFILLAVYADSSDPPVDYTNSESSDAKGDTYSYYTHESNVSPATLNINKMTSMPDTMAQAMKNFQIASHVAYRQVINGVLPQEETNKQYSRMARMLEDILEHMYTDDNAYSFLQAKGIDVIISPTIHIDNPELRTPLLQLIKALFNIAHTTTVKMMPITILDELVDILEKYNDVTIKTYVIEILSRWLPNNIEAQTRIMKMKGFEPFYKQLSKIEPTLTKITLELFNKILEEHIVKRKKSIQRNKSDYIMLQLYQRIGLIERMSTPAMCNSFLRIFQEFFSYGSFDELPPVLKLLQTIRPFCINVFKGKPGAIALINQVLKYIREPTRRLDLEERGIDVNKLEEDMTGFAQIIELKPHNDL